MSQAYQEKQRQNPYVATDMYNQGYNQYNDAELIDMDHGVHPIRNKPRPFDWFICSVLGYFCFCWTGVCAMYYAVRANHAVDWDKSNEEITRHTRRAKCLTITSIGIGVAFIVIFIIWFPNRIESYRHGI